MTLITPGTAILITGASGGVGLEIAAQGAEAGGVIGVHGSRLERSEEAIAKVRARTEAGTLIATPADFTKAGAIEQVVEDFVAKAGKLDAVIHCATINSGGKVSGPFLKTDPDAYGQAAANLLGGYQRLCFAALPHLAKNGGGTIVGFASDAGRFAAARQSVVGGIFGGIYMFTRNLAVEAGRDNVRVHAISPSYVVDTPVFEMFGADRAARAMERAPLGLPSPKDIAPVCLFLCGPGATKITGQIISVNGGLNA